jgi:hypothetical protein
MTLKSPLTQITSMQTRVEKLAVCLYTRGVTEVSLQLSERQTHGARTYKNVGLYYKHQTL